MCVSVFKRQSSLAISKAREIDQAASLIAPSSGTLGSAHTLTEGTISPITSRFESIGSLAAAAVVLRCD